LKKTFPNPWPRRCGPRIGTIAPTRAGVRRDCRMGLQDQVLLIGASTRAAAFSALRAGLRPWCADLFNDADLRGRCPSVALVPGTYPQGFVAAVQQAPPA